jgi:hypothetical protein
MKLLFAIIILAFSVNVSAQKKPIKKVWVIQDGKKYKAKKGVITIDKAPFTLVFKFKSDINDMGLLADSTQNLDFSQSEFGGAFSYGNDYKEMKMWGSKVFTNLPVKGPKEHCFDSLAIEKKWSIGTREVVYFDTDESVMIVEEYPTDTLYCSLAKVEHLDGKYMSWYHLNFALYLKDIPPKSKYDVKGRSFAGEPGEYQEGCEGCGNAASFKFLKNGKEVEYLPWGSDMYEFGTYTQEGNQVKINDSEYSFTVAEDVESLISNRDKSIIYKRTE